MKNKMTRNWMLAGIIALGFCGTGCLKDQTTYNQGNGGSGGSTTVIPGNDAIDAKLFEVVNMDLPGLEKAKAHYQAKEYYLAARELLGYYRNRTHIVNPDVNLISPSITVDQQKWADQALARNGYRFYVKNYFDPAVTTDQVPYSYKGANGIDWTLWPTKENEQRYQLHRHQWFLPQAYAYRVSSDETYVKAWIEVYSDWLAKNPRPEVDLDYTIDPSHQPEGFQNAGFAWRPLEVAVRVKDQCGLLLYFMHSTNFTPEWFSTFMVHFAEQVNHIVKNYSATSNQLITQAQSVTYAGVLFPELKDAATWVSSGSTVLSREIEAQFLPDGMSYELDLSYLIGSIEDFRSAMLVAQLNGMADRFPVSYVESMRKMTDVVMNLTYPNYTVPNMNDTRAAGLSKNVLMRNFTNYYNLFPENQELQWMATAGKGGTKPTHLTKAFANSGYYVLRNGWESSSTMMILQNGPQGEWHSQPDNGTFEIYINGRNFFPDSGVFSYAGDATANANRAKYAATKEHNTMTLNGKNLTGRAGALLKMETVGQTDVLVTENPSYAGLTHRRAVFFVDKTFFVLVDEGIGNATGVVNLNFNLLETSAKEPNAVLLDLDQFGAHTAFADKNNILVRSFVPTGTQAVAKPGFVSYNIGLSSDRMAYQLNYTKPAAQTARFITVILPCEEATVPVVSAEFMDEDHAPSGVTIRVTIDGKAYDLNYTL
ncbi:MAG: heparinase II/III family protein [Alistipes sp.]